MIVEKSPYAIAKNYPGLTAGDIYHVFGWHVEEYPSVPVRAKLGAEKPEGWIRMVKKAKKEIQDGRLKILHSELSPTWEAEVRFHSDRKWRFDFADWHTMVAIEVEGGVWTRGRHSRGPGMIADMEKYNSATSMGWRVFRVIPEQFGSRSMVESVLHLLKNDKLRREQNEDPHRETDPAA